MKGWVVEVLSRAFWVGSLRRPMQSRTVARNSSECASVRTYSAYWRTTVKHAWPPLQPTNMVGPCSPIHRAPEQFPGQQCDAHAESLNPKYKSPICLTYFLYPPYSSQEASHAASSRGYWNGHDKAWRTFGVPFKRGI